MSYDHRDIILLLIYEPKFTTSTYFALLKEIHYRIHRTISYRIQIVTFRSRIKVSKVSSRQVSSISHDHRDILQLSKHKPEFITLITFLRFKIKNYRFVRTILHRI